MTYLTVEEARARRERFAALNPSLARRIMGKGPDCSNAKESQITVNLTTGERLIERAAPPTAQPKPRAAPVPTKIPEEVPGYWISTPGGKQALLQSERIGIAAELPRVGEIMRAVSVASGITVAQLMGLCRIRKFTYPRYVAILLTRELRPDLSLPKIGFLFGNRNHSSIMKAEDVAREVMDKIPRVRGWYEEAKATLERIDA